MLGFLGVIAVLALLYYTPGTSGPAPTKAAPAHLAVPAVLLADQSRLQAMMAGNSVALGQLFSEELRFVHSDGRIETKAEYLNNLMAGDTAYADAKTTDVQALQPAPNVVIVIGAQEMRKRLGGNWSDIKLRYMAVWRSEGDAWRMYAWQSMRPAGNSIVPRTEAPNSKTQTPKKSQ